MPARDREEAKDVAGLGDRGADGAGLLIVWYTTDGSISVLLPETNVDVH